MLSWARGGRAADRNAEGGLKQMRAHALQVDVVHAITAALNRDGAKSGAPLGHPASAYVTAVLVPEGSAIAVDEAALAAAGVETVVAVGSHRDVQGRCFYDAEKLVAELQRIVQGPGGAPHGRSHTV